MPKETKTTEATEVSEGQATEQTAILERDRLEEEMYEKRRAEELGAEAVEEPKESGGVDDSILSKDESGSFFIKLKVDGEEKSMTLEQAQAELQRRESGSARLQQAAEAYKQLEERTKALEEREQFLTKATEEEQEESLEETAREILSDIMNADEDAAAEKLASMIKNVSGARPATEDQNKIIDLAVQRAKQEAAEQSEAQEALNSFFSEYPELLPETDPVAFKMADTMTDIVVAENPDWSKKQIFLEAGKRVREFRGKSDESPRKQARSNIQQMPAAGTARQTSMVERQSTSQQSVSEYVENERRLRRGERAAL